MQPTLFDTGDRPKRRRKPRPANPSPLPWKVDGLCIRDAAGRVVGSVASYEAVTLAVMRANAERIVAAVNRDQGQAKGEES